MEYWKHIEGYNKKYMISSLGRVMSNKKNGEGKILKPTVRGSGYLGVTLSKSGSKESFYIHRLVYSAFMFNIPDGMQINHIDGDKSNNCVVNLEVVSDKQNKAHAYSKGLYEEYTNSLKKPITGVNIDTGELIRFGSMTEASSHGFNKAHISSCIKGKRKTHKNYKWYLTNNNDTN